MRRRRLIKRKSKILAPSVVHYVSVGGAPAICVECTYGGTKIGPRPGQKDSDVRKAMTQLTHECDCGRRGHSPKFAEGTVPKESLLGL